MRSKKVSKAGPGGRTEPEASAPILALNLSDDEFRLLADNLPTLCWIANGDGYIVWYNRRWYDYTGATPDQMEGWGWQAVHDPAVLPSVMKRWTDAISSGQPFEMTFPLRSADGRFRPFLTRIQPYRDASGQVARWFGINIDISAQASAEERLRDSAERLRLSAYAAQIGTWDLDLGGGRGRWDEAALRIGALDVEQADYDAGNWTDVVHPDDRDTVRRAFEASLEPDAAPYEVEFRGSRPAPDGGPRWIVSHGAVVRDPATGAPVRAVGIMRDITARRRAEELLRDSEAKFHAIVNSIDQMIWSTRPDGFHDYYNDRWYEYTGVPHGTTDGEGWNDMFHPEDRDRAWALWRDCLETGEPYHIEYRLRHRSGRYRWVIGRAQCVRDAAGSITRWYGTCTDIHDLKVAQERLAEESRTLETLNRVGTALAAELDLERVVQMVTDAGVELTGARFGAYFHNLYDEAGERLALFTLSGAERSAFESLGRPRATPIFAPTLRNDGIIRSDDIMTDPRYGGMGGMPKGHVPVRSYLAVPVASRSGEVLGALLFGHPDAGRFTDRHERLMVAVAAQAAIAIDNARLYQDAQRELDERRRGEAHRQLLVNELNHRVKNTLAIVQGIAQQSFRQDEVSPEARLAFEGRLAALAAAHNLLTRENWEAAELRQVVEDAISAHLGPGQRQVIVSGPDMRVAPKAAVSIAMALHELATNATKYGALSTDIGCVRLTWRIDPAEGGDRLHLEWREEGGPPTSPPARRGFGTRMIERGLAAELGGTVRLDFRREGLVCTIDAPLPRA